jgi:hypothetical protein
MSEITDLDELVTLPKQHLMDMIKLGVFYFAIESLSDEEVDKISNEIILDYQMNKK